MNKINSTTNDTTDLKFDSESEIGDNVGIDQPSRGRQLFRSNSLFTAHKVEPGQRLPTAFKTVSNNIDDVVSQHQPIQKGDASSKFQNVTWHSDDITKIADEFEVDLVNGLSSSQVDAKFKKFGRNVQSKPPSDVLRKVFLNFFGGLGSLLFIGGVLVIICYKPLGDPPQASNLALGIILLVVFVIQAALNFFQEYSSNRVMKSITDMIPLEVKVIRDGNVVWLKSQSLVPGDLVVVDANTKIPADIRIFELHGLLFDRCILTGETVACKGLETSSNPNYLESESIAMQGTFCIGGYGKGIVVSTGDHTIFGEIAKLSSASRKKLTTLQKELFRFVAYITIVIVSLIVFIAIFWGAYLKKRYPNWINTTTLIVDLVSVAVSFIPEGLPISLAVCLTITAYKMKQSNILCKSLNIVETLGSVSVLCCDKTGTLTTGKMTVTDHYGELKSLTKLGLLCNDTDVNDEKVFTGGNQTDEAILNFCLDNGTSHNDFDDYKLIHTVRFTSKLKYMVKVYQRNNKYLLTVKGAPDVLFAKAKFFKQAASDILIDDDVSNKLMDKQLEWSRNGQRVILLGSKVMDMFDEDTFDLNDITIEGLLSLSDPLRPKIPQVVSDLKTAGIRLVMITGDFQITAKSIAEKCGIITTEYMDTIDNLGDNLSDDENELKALIINGTDMYRLSEVDWDKVTQYTQIVFSRTTPEQKLRIVKEFQNRGHVVGMTGDGVNDSPSIKQADVGIAMADGSEIAKEASDLVLLDSFTSIVEALLYGRLVFENVKKTICYLLPAGCYSELWAVLLNCLAGFPQVLSSFYMIIISCITDCIGSMIISFEGPEKNLLLKKPRCVSGERLVNWKLLVHSYIVFGTFDCFSAMLLAFLNFTRNGVPFNTLNSYGNYSDPQKINNLLPRSSSIYFVHLVIMQFFNLLVVRSRYISLFQNLSWRLLIIFPIFASTFIWTNIPAIKKALVSGTVPVEYYFISMGFGLVLVAFDETRKLIVRNYPKSFVAKMAW